MVDGSEETEYPALTVEDIVQLLAPLDEREREVLKLRLGLDRGEPRTLQEVADHFQLRPERIAQIVDRAMAKLRNPHTADCMGGDPCEPIEGSWDQPPGDLVAEAEAQLRDNAPWCVVRKRAWALDPGTDET